MTAERRKILIGTCQNCGRFWLVSPEAAVTETRCQCGGLLEFSLPPTPPAGVGGVILPPAPEPARKPRKEPKRKKPVVAIPRKEPLPKPIELPAWVEPAPLSDYQVLMLGAQCGSHVLSGSPAREEFKEGEVITLISRLWSMALWLEAGKIGGDE